MDFFQENVFNVLPHFSYNLRKILNRKIDNITRSRDVSCIEDGIDINQQWIAALSSDLWWGKE